MSYALLRLAGPIQSWGEQSLFDTRGTLRYPTFAALRGMLRAAAGHGREAGVPVPSWVLNLDISLRIDRPGEVFHDFNTVAPRDKGFQPFLIPQGDLTPSGKAQKWMKGEVPLIQRKHYLQEALFFAALEGDEGDIKAATEALMSPHWTLSLGRKSCVPAGILFAGTSNLPLEWSEIPGYKLSHHEEGVVKVKVHSFTPDPQARKISHQDLPLGNCPHDGYITKNRFEKQIEISNLDSYNQWRSWAKEELSR